MPAAKSIAALSRRSAFEIAGDRLDKMICLFDRRQYRLAVDFLVRIVRDETDLIHLSHGFAVLDRDVTWFDEVLTESGDEAAVSLDGFRFDLLIARQQCRARRIEDRIIGAIACSVWTSRLEQQPCRDCGAPCPDEKFGGRQRGRPSRRMFSRRRGLEWLSGCSHSSSQMSSGWM